MALRSGQQYHEFWGTFASASQLPNVLGATVQKATLQAGDYAWVSAEQVAYRCLNATLGAAIWVAEPWNDPTLGIITSEDWISLTPVGNTGWSVATAGAGSSAQINNATADASHDGIVELDTGNGATGLCALYQGLDGMVSPAAGGTLLCQMAVRFPVLSDGVDNYITRVGFGDSIVAGVAPAWGDHTDGIYFEYDFSLSGNVWRCKTAAGGVRATTVTASAIAANTWYKLVIEATSAQVRFYVNGTLVATNVANIPAGAAQRYAPNLRIQKIANTGVRAMLVDYFQMRLVTATAR